jgi:hypothetical protein
MQGAPRAPLDVFYTATPENPIPKLKLNSSAVIVPITRAVIGARCAPYRLSQFGMLCYDLFFGKPLKILVCKPASKSRCAF